MRTIFDSIVKDSGTNIGRLRIIEADKAVTTPELKYQFNIRRIRDDIMLSAGKYRIFWEEGDIYSEQVHEAIYEAIQETMNRLGLPEKVNPSNIKIEGWHYKERDEE